MAIPGLRLRLTTLSFMLLPVSNFTAQCHRSLWKTAAIGLRIARADISKYVRIPAQTVELLVAVKGLLRTVREIFEVRIEQTIADSHAEERNFLSISDLYDRGQLLAKRGLAYLDAKAVLETTRSELNENAVAGFQTTEYLGYSSPLFVLEPSDSKVFRDSG